MPAATEKTCSRCHAIFACGAAHAGEQCWCEQLPHVPFAADEPSDCFCPACLKMQIAEVTLARTKSLAKTDRDSMPELIEGEDYYVEGAAVVFTERYHLRRGYCCESGCRHCPYLGS